MLFVTKFRWGDLDVTLLALYSIRNNLNPLFCSATPPLSHPTNQGVRNSNLFGRAKSKGWINAIQPFSFHNVLLECFIHLNRV